MLAVVIVVMVAATFVEKMTGSATGIYGSWWFAALWALLAASGLAYVFARRMLHRPFLLLLHVSLVIILAGALITHVWGRQGELHLRMDQPGVSAFLADGGRVADFPFTVRLMSFEVANYPGTSTPMDYISRIGISGPSAAETECQISMNNIGQHQGYRFYQAAYDPDLQGTTLSVAYDPWGIGVTYVGYGLLFLSMIILLIHPREGFRQALRRLRALAVIALLSWPMAHARPSADGLKVLSDTLANQFCDLYAYYNGRICPLQTVAYDFTSKLYGKPRYAGYTAEQVFTGWLFFPTKWMEQPLKKAKNKAAADEQQAIIQMLHAGRFMRIYPYRVASANDTTSTTSLTWFSQSDNLPLDMDEPSWYFVKKSMNYVAELAVMQQYDKMSYTVGKIRKFQMEQAADVLPSDAHFRAEKLYNSCNATRPLAMAFATLGIVLFAFYLRFWLKGRRLPRWSVVAVNAVMALALIYQIVFLGVRWYVSGHLPLTNGHETMQFLAVVVMSFTLALQRRFVLIMPFGYLLSGLTLLVSMMGQSNPQITPLMPVLSSPLLSSHVCIIMVAYALLAFTFLNGLTSLFVRDEAKLVQLQDISRVLLYPALFCMAGGIFIGAIWANVSWGRYWGWDPKEVWALITLLFYSFALHSQSLPQFRRPRFFHAFMVIAFLTVLMTYFGVNFLLGGMHSYANG